MIERSLALEIEDGVDDVLEGLGTSDASAFRDMPDDEYGGAALLREAHESRGAFANLADVPRGPFEIGGEDRLDRVHDHHPGLHSGGSREDGLEQGLDEQLDIGRGMPEAIGAELHLKRRLLAGDV